MNFSANALATGIGSLPHTDSKKACDLIFRNLPNVPYWPQLSKRTFLENMYIQYSENMPGARIKDEGIFIQANGTKFPEELERFYESYLSEDIEQFSISKDHASGFYSFIENMEKIKNAVAIKGQITGPISFGLSVTDADKKSILYDDNLKDVLIKQLTRKAQWQIEKMIKQNSTPIMFLDEPYLSSYGSAYVSLNREDVLASFNAILTELNAICGIHCCGKTDWSLLLDTSTDILSFDAYSFMDSLFLFEESLVKFLKRGGIIAWGIVPTSIEDLDKENQNSLLDRLNSAFSKLNNLGFDLTYILKHSMITPSCGLGTLPVEVAESILQLTGNISTYLRKANGLA